jgi:hypothetical protein
VNATHRISATGKRVPTRYRSHVAAEYVHLITCGESFDQVARHVGITRAGLARTLHRNGYTHLIPRGGWR